MRTLTIREFYPLTRNFYIPAIHHALFTIKYRRKAVYREIKRKIFVINNFYG